MTKSEGNPKDEVPTEESLTVTRSQDSTQRFSGRVDYYIRYRPRYPAAILEPLRTDCLLISDSTIADVGSGTGFLAELFLSNGNTVFGIEPNNEMRKAGERLLRTFPKFHSVAGTAESTDLESESVDFVAAGQAFHWFDLERCREEFERILRPQGWVVLVWNDRRTDSTPFLAEYENLLQRYGTDYKQVDHKQIDAAVLSEFFRSEPIKKSFPNYQHFGYPSVEGRLLSSSYVPDATQPGYKEMLSALNKLFDAHQDNGRVTFEYDTLLYYGQIHP
jgi:SAM-dependent methyltransferase